MYIAIGNYYELICYSLNSLFKKHLDIHTIFVLRKFIKTTICFYTHNEKKKKPLIYFPWWPSYDIKEFKIFQVVCTRL